MKNLIENAIIASIATKQNLLKNCIGDIEFTGIMLADTFKRGNKVLLCGNGGSAADSQHIAAELVIRYRSSVERKALPAIALSVDSSALTAGGNDYGFDKIFSRQVEALGNEGDILIGISTSGNSQNVIEAVQEAKSKQMKSVCLLGGEGGKLQDICDYSVTVPSDITARIQESHILIGHIWCEIIEEKLFLEKN